MLPWPKKSKYGGFTKYRPPQRLKRYGKVRGKKKLDSICERLGNKLHLSSSKIRMEYFPLLQWLLEKNKETETYMEERLGLEENQIEAIEEF